MLYICKFLIFVKENYKIRLNLNIYQTKLRVEYVLKSVNILIFTCI